MTFTINTDIVGYVYLIEQDGKYKIGCSGNPSHRLLQVADPKRARIVHLIPSSSPAQIESALQRRFADKYISGEWFSLDNDDVALVCNLGRIDAVDDLPLALVSDPSVKTPGRGRPKTRDGDNVIQARVNDDLFKALDELAKEGRRTKNAELVIALEFYAQSKGRWPRPPEKSEGGQ